MEIKNIKERWNTTILGILRELISICERHGLHYYCCAGTAIGAVRHHGIIPWDDDIDVIMPRPDYDRLLEIAQQEDFGQYELITPYNNPAYPLYFAKLSDRTTTLVEERERPCVIGLFVDIFPLDATSGDIEEARRERRRYSKLLNRLNAISTRNTFPEYISLLKKRKEWGRFVIKTAAWFFRSAIRRKLLKEMDIMSHRHDYAAAENVQVFTGSYGDREIFPKSWLGRGSLFEFDGLQVTLPEEYDKYLRHFFGDYMQLPPIEQRVEKHHRAYLNMDKRETTQEVMKKLRA